MNFNQPNTILCKPMVTISGQHFLKFEIHNANLTSSFTRQIPALVRVLPLNAILGIIYLKYKLQTTKHKLMQASSDQWLSAIFETHNSNLTSSFTWQILVLVRTLPLNVILKIIYLIHELPSTKHLVSMDTFTISLLQPSLKHFQNL